MEKTKEMTLKHRLQKLSEEPTPFFHSLLAWSIPITLQNCDIDLNLLMSKQNFKFFAISFIIIKICL